MELKICFFLKAWFDPLCYLGRIPKISFKLFDSSDSDVLLFYWHVKVVVNCSGKNISPPHHCAVGGTRGSESKWRKKYFFTRIQQYFTGHLAISLLKKLLFSLAENRFSFPSSLPPPLRFWNKTIGVSSCIISYHMSKCKLTTHTLKVFEHIISATGIKSILFCALCLSLSRRHTQGSNCSSFLVLISLNFHFF